MRLAQEKGGLKDRFRQEQVQGDFVVMAKALVEPPASKGSESKPDYVRFAEQDDKSAADVRDRDMQGQKSGATAGTIAYSATASRRAMDAAQDEAEKKAKQQADDLFLLGLLEQEIRALTKQISFHQEQADLLGDTLDALQDGSMDMETALEQSHVKRAIAEWEKRNPGQQFDPDGENAKELLEQIIAEQQELDVAQVGRLGVAREQAISSRDELIGMRASGASQAELDQRASEILTNIEQSKSLQVDTSIDATVLGLGSTSHNAQRDDEFAEEENIVASADGFDLDWGAGGDKLAASSANFEGQFKTAAALPKDDASEIALIKGVAITMEA